MIEITKPQKDYELLDSGDGLKLERYGKFVLSRPDPQVLWKKKLSEDVWQNADAIFEKGEVSKWKIKKEVPEKWEIEIQGLSFEIYLSKFKHVGIFPEQLSNWLWMSDLIKKAGRPVKILNLFGYTGGASIACLKAGAEVVHVDASKTSIEHARMNAEISGLSEKPIRWILDDAYDFVKREIRRGNKYDGIIMDPPAFGRGPKGEIWKIEENFLPLVDDAKKILSDNPLFFLINGYASGYSPIAYEENLSDLKKLGGSISSGELTIEEKESGRLLPAGIFARWNK